MSGFVTAVGGITSHAAIIARAKGIPYVANVDIRMLRRVDLQSLIVDGSQGLIIANPNRQSLKRYLLLVLLHVIMFEHYLQPELFLLFYQSHQS